MNTMPEISVVFPIYNQEKYLSGCLYSFQRQTFTDFELLLIDDGSTDGTPELCDVWGIRDKRIRVFHKKNGGVSSARNEGIEQAQGRYIVFCEPDDYVEPDYLLHLYQLLPDGRNEDGFVVQGYEKNDGNGLNIENKHFMFRCYFNEEIKILLKSKEFGGMFSPWAKLFSRSFLNEHHLRFEPQLSYFEDVLFILNSILHSNYIVVGDCVDYHYILRAGTLSRKVSSFYSEYNAFVLCDKMINSLSKKYRLNSREIEAPFQALYLPLCRALKADYHVLSSVSGTERREHLKLLRAVSLDYMTSYYIPAYLIDKLGRFLLKSNYVWIYDRLFTLLFRLKVKKMFCPPF